MRPTRFSVRVALARPVTPEFLVVMQRQVTNESDCFTGAIAPVDCPPAPCLMHAEEIHERCDPSRFCSGDAT